MHPILQELLKFIPYCINIPEAIDNFVIFNLGFPSRKRNM